MTPDPNAAMAVIRAAQAWTRTHPDSEDANTALNDLAQAVRALDHAIEEIQIEDSIAGEGPTEIEWQHVMPGDQLKADKGENFYPVEHVEGLRMTVNLGGRGLKALERAPGRIVTVVRGPEGVACDMLRSAGLGPTLIDTENHS